ncbi:MAG: hypothetical protein JWR52_3338 [Marmoricola sp.]|nr:hypothetical protein [Marmoricola sp.]
MVTTSVTPAGLASLSGLTNGVDTNSIITQLMSLEAQTQNNLKAQKTTEQQNVTTLQDLNTTFANLATSAATLADPTYWNPVTVTSSNTLVTATANSGAQTGSLSVTVGSTASAQQLRFNNTAALTDTVTTGSPKFLITRADGSTEQLDSSNNTLGGMIAAINATGTGLKATTTKLDDGTYRLQVVSATSGAASNFTMTNLDGSAILGGATVTAGSDASITIGGDTVHSANNTFANIANGLSITLDPTAPANTTVTFSVTQDATSMTSAVGGFVTSINAALTKINTLTAPGTSGQSAGPLSTDSGIQQLGNNLLDAVYPTDGTSLASIGIQLDRYGAMTWDAATFQAAYTADPAGTAAKFTKAANGFANRIQTIANAASDPVTGSITTSITNHNSTITELTASIADWDARLALRQASLQEQFTAMQTALSQLNSQSSYLNSALGLTPSSSSSSSSSNPLG